MYAFGIKKTVVIFQKQRNIALSRSLSQHLNDTHCVPHHNHVRSDCTFPNFVILLRTRKVSERLRERGGREEEVWAAAAAAAEVLFCF